VRRDFIEPVDPVHTEYTGVVVDAQIIVLGPADFFAVMQSDNKHDAVL
jgi:hypothetical protein